MDQNVTGGSTSAESPGTVPPATEVSKKAPGRRNRAAVVLLIFAIAALAIGFRWWLAGKTNIETDNAFIESHIHAVSARVPGIALRVPVSDNQFVRRGDLLVVLDPADYRVRTENTEAALAMARNETSGDYAQIESARAAIGQARAKLDQSDLDLQRGKALFAKEVIPREQLDRLVTARKIAAAQLEEAQKILQKAEALVGIGTKGAREARIAQKQAQVAEARLNLSYTSVYSPGDGYITRKSVETGNYVQPGQPLMAIVSLDDAWITANYKERQLTHVRPGQRVEFTVDTYHGRTFRGTVESIMAGTGAAFSLLPPENATGNYVKVVQRIPVKIAIDAKSDPEHLLRVGMSVVPTILVERRFGDIVQDLNPFQKE